MRFKSDLKLVNITDSTSLLSCQFHRLDGNAFLSSSLPENKSTSCFKWETRCLVRIFQTAFILLLIYTLYFILQNLFFHRHRGESSPLSEEPIFPHLASHDLKEPPWTRLLDIEDFKLVLQPSQDFCRLENLLFLVVIHSKPSHFSQRRAIRSTWGSLEVLNDEQRQWNIRLVFILGNSPMNRGRSYYNITSSILQEDERHGDIILGSFLDEYHNLRYKNILGLRWSSTYCSNAKFILKTDDDAFVDIPGLYYYLSRTFGPLENKHFKKFLGGNVFPEGTKPNRDGKWAVSITEYPWDKYPSYLGGLAYLLTPDVARDLSRAAHHQGIRPLWVDDVFVTGVLANALDLHPFYLNARYIYEHEDVSQWLQRARIDSPPPFTFAHLNASQANWNFLLHKLWIHVQKAYNISINIPEEVNLLKGVSIR